MKNVKTLLIFITISTFVFASNTRTDALGGSGFWADDYANVWNFPASVNNHNVAYTSGNNFATIFDQNGTKWGFSGGNNNIGDEVVNMNWGSNGMGVRLGLGMTAEIEAVAADATLGTAAVEGVDAVATYKFGFGMSDLAGMAFGLGYDDSGTIGLNLRRTQDIWLWDNILIGFGMQTEDFDRAVDPQSNMTFGLDCYTNRSYGDGTNGLFALGFHYGAVGQSAKDADDAPDATMNLVWNWAVESEMTDWATIRLGYSSMYDAGGGDNETGTLTSGIGFNYDSFQLDMSLFSVDSMLKDPVKYMTGRNETGKPLGAAWTVTYSW